MLLVEGKPGLGKSALLSQAAGTASDLGFVVAVAAADEISRFEPAGPLLAALGQAPLRKQARAPGGNVGRGPASLVENIGKCLEQMLHAGPLLVSLDDLQWADA